MTEVQTSEILDFCSELTWLVAPDFINLVQVIKIQTNYPEETMVDQV
jgi:hypothetical protein